MILLLSKISECQAIWLQAYKTKLCFWDLPGTGTKILIGDDTWSKTERDPCFTPFFKSPVLTHNLPHGL